MKILTNLQHKTSYSSLHSFTDFPTNPSIGSLVFKSDGIVYIYNTLDSVTAWRPLNIKAKTFVYTQESTVTTWNVNHNLGSTDLIYFIYDGNNVLQEDAGITFTDNDNIVLSFTTPTSGKVVIFADGDNYSGVSSTGETSTGSGNLTAYRVRIQNWSTVSIGSDIPLANLTFSSNISGWTINKEADANALITHTVNSRPCGHDVMKGENSDNKSYPPSTLRGIEYISDSQLRIYGYLNDDDLYITIFFVS